MSESKAVVDEPMADDAVLGFDQQDAVIEVEELTVDVPHWKFDRQDFLKVLEIVSKFPTIHTAYFFMEYQKPGHPDDKGSVRIVSTDKDYFLDCNLTLLNQDYVYGQAGTFCVDVHVLSKLVVAYSDFVILFEEDKPHYFNSHVKYQLDLFKLDINEFLVELPEEKRYADFSMDKEMFGSARKLVSQATRITDTRALLINGADDTSTGKVSGRMVGFFTLYSFNFELPFELMEPFYLRKTDFDVISCLYSYNGISYQTDKKRVWFGFPLGQVSFTKIPYDQKMAMSILSKEQIGTSEINMSWIKRALTVLLSFGVKDLRFVRDGETVYLRYRDTANFKLGLGEMTGEFLTAAGILKRVMLSLPDVVGHVKATYTSTGMAVSFEDEIGLKYLCEISRMSSVQGE